MIEEHVSTGYDFNVKMMITIKCNIVSINLTVPVNINEILDSFYVLLPNGDQITKSKNFHTLLKLHIVYKNELTFSYGYISNSISLFEYKWFRNNAKRYMVIVLLLLANLPIS